MRQFRKKPVVIEAVRFDGSNGHEILQWTDGDKPTVRSQIVGEQKLEIHTLEGTMTADVGDWVIRGVKGEFYPCKPDIFAVTYDPV